MKSVSLLLALGLAAVAPPSPHGTAPDGEVRAVSLVASPGRAELVVTVSGAVSVRDLTLRDPDRLVIDVHGAVLNAMDTPAYDGINRAGVRNVRLRQFAPEVVRIVLDLDAPMEYRVAQEGDLIRVTFGTDETFLAWSTMAPVRMVSDPASLTSTASEIEPYLPSPAPRPQAQEPRITVSWDNANIADVVAGFMALSGRSIILGKGVGTATVTAEIRDKPWTQAFQAVLAANGLSAQEMPGGIIRVDSPAALAEIDSLEPLETTILRINYARAVEIAASISGILTEGKGKAVADTASNSLILTDKRNRIEEIAEFVKGLDIRTPQVSIQAKIIFVDRTDITQLGLKYDLGNDSQFFNKLVQRQDPNGEPGETFDPNTNIVDLGGNTVSAIANADAIINGSALDLVFSTAIGGFSLTSFLSALERVELSDIQAEPVITALDNRRAKILVGEEIPVRIIDLSSTGTGANTPRSTVQFKETGISLTVTPHVTNNREILMNLVTERSAIQPLAAADLGFTITKQSSENQLLVKDGETAVIGGLTVTTVSRTRNGIPILGSLPLIGSLFSFTNDTENRRDLIILVTPRIIDDGATSN